MFPVNILISRERRRQKLKKFNIERVILRNKYNPFDLDDFEFRRRYRLTKNLAYSLIEDLLPHMKNYQRRNSIEPSTRILVALSFFATGSYQRTIGQSHNISISQQSASNCIREVSYLITNHLREKFIKFPTTEAEKTEVKLGFQQKFHFPGVIGALDCTHIKILRPVNEEHNFLNRKGYHSINTQIICDSNLKILALNPQHAGATHDAFIWRMSLIRQELERQYRLGYRQWLLGDSGYPLQPWLMTPIIDAPENTPEGRYNRAHCSARNTIERCNGVLKQRFRCLGGDRSLRYDPVVVGQIITSCAVLHNICIINNLNADEELENFPQETSEVPTESHLNHLYTEGLRTRNQFIARYFQ